MFNLVDGSHTTATGYHETAIWLDKFRTNVNLSILYTTDERATIVSLNCSTDGTEKFEVLGEYPMCFYNFRLTHKCACWDGCKSKFIINKKKLFIFILFHIDTTNYTFNDIKKSILIILTLLALVFLIFLGFIRCLNR